MKDDKKKKKKDQDEEINEEAQDDINEVDDSFGLPDVDFKPLDEEEDDAEAREEEAKAKTETENLEKSPQEAEEKSGRPFGSIDDEFEDDKNNPSAKQDEKEEEPETFKATVEEAAGGRKFEKRFEHPKESSAGGKIILGILTAVIIAGAIWYLGFYRPAQKEKEEQARQEQLDRQRKEDELARQREEEQQEALAREQEEQKAEDETAVTPGEVMILSERTGRYYVVIGSFIDEDLAKDLSDEIGTDGIGSMILSPPQKGGFFRVAISDHPTFNDAQNAANGRKGSFGDSVWVLKY